MIYKPTDGDIHNYPIKCRPRTCFLMTQLGTPVPAVVVEIRKRLTRLMRRSGITILDANAVVTGRDFLQKIWEMILSVPMGVAIVDKSMKTNALCNIYYEIGLMQAYGKETLLVKTFDTKVPSDFVRTEYVVYDGNFVNRIKKFISKCEEQARFHLLSAQSLIKNPPLAFDYYRRSYLMTGDKKTQDEARQALQTEGYNEVCGSCNALDSSWIQG